MACWATEHERTTPAPTLDELAKFDRGRRVAIFNAVSAEVKASLFQEQLRRFSQRADLTATQRELIAEGLTLITPALYRQEPAASQSLRLFWARAEPSFNSPEQPSPVAGCRHHSSSVRARSPSADQAHEYITSGRRL